MWIGNLDHQHQQLNQPPWYTILEWGNVRCGHKVWLQLDHYIYRGCYRCFFPLSLSNYLLCSVRYVMFESICFEYRYVDLHEYQAGTVVQFRNKNRYQHLWDICGTEEASEL